MDISLATLLGTAGISVASRAAEKLAQVVQSSFARLLDENPPASDPTARDLQLLPFSPITAVSARSLTEALSEFHERLRQLLETAGLDPTWPIHIGWDGQSGLTVVAAHPQRQELDSLIGHDRELVRSFRQIAQLYQGSFRSGVGDDGDNAAQGGLEEVELVWSSSGVTIQ